MILALQIVFWLSIFIILHSYVLYPTILSLVSKKRNLKTYSREEQLPFVSILISIYNEEDVIAQKINTILSSDYPNDKYEILIGSDCSSDNSNEIVSTYAQKYSNIHLFEFTERQGKQNIINKIINKSNADILIMTDANVMFDKQTIFELVKYYKDEGVGLVDSQMINKGIVEAGISVQESSYISREVKIKTSESNIWGTMMGPFGGCYSIRKDLYQPVPENYLVDDFYINMVILEQGYKSVNNTKAKVFEDVSNNLLDEFKRKIRISTGNFQNLKHFKHLLFLGFGAKSSKISEKRYYSDFGLSFSFLSHKVLRWLVPFILIFFTITSVLLINKFVYLIIFIGFLSTFLIPIIDIVLKKINIHISILRFVTHFYTMNLSLFIGFFKSLKGVKSGVWEPTKRNQSEN